MSIAARLGGQMNRMRQGGYGTASALPMSGGMAMQGPSLTDAALGGGMAAKIAPAQLPRVQRPGFAGFAERFVNPDMSTPGGALTMAARYAGAAFGEPVSASLLNMEQDRQLQQRQAQQQELQSLNVAKARRELTQPEYLRVGDSVVSVDPETRAFTEVYTAPTPEPEPTPFMRNFTFLEGLSPERQTLARPMLPGFGFTPEAQTQRIETAGAVADRQGAARARYREAPGGGGQTRTIGGRTFVKVGDQWFER